MRGLPVRHFTPRSDVEDQQPFYTKIISHLQDQVELDSLGVLQDCHCKVAWQHVHRFRSHNAAVR